MENLEEKTSLIASSPSSVEPMKMSIKASIDYKGLKPLGEIPYSSGTSIKYWM